MNKIILTNTEASLPNGKVVLLRLMKSQPPKGYSFTGIVCNESCFINTSVDVVFTHEIKVPYPLKTPLGIREGWAWSKYYSMYFYKVDIPEYPLPNLNSHVFLGLKWQSPVTMPADAIRRWFTIGSVGCEERNGKYYWILKGEIHGTE